MAPSLEGRLYDPAWLLGKQWVVGEFVGDDAGSPIHAELQVVSSPFAAYQSGTAKPIACGQVPLDAVAGPEERGEMTLFESAEAGAQLMTLLANYKCSPQGRSALVAKYPLPTPPTRTADAQGMSYLALLAGRLPDAVVVEPLARQAVANGIIPPAVGIPVSDDDAFLKAAADWITWLDALMLRATANGDAWVDASLDHQFTVGVAQPASTTASVAAGSVTLPISWVDGIAIGMSVTGPSIPDGATVVALSVYSVALTQMVLAELPQGSKISFGAAPLVMPTNADAPAGSINLPFSSTDGIEVGMSVSGLNIPNGTIVGALTASITLSAAVSAEVPAASNIALSAALVASAWDGERIDWYDIDADPQSKPPVAPGVDPVTGLLTLEGPPRPLEYPGMPPHRWWQFDEGYVNFAQITASKDDLARMLVVEFACLYSNDWYLWPLRLPVASLNVIQNLSVTNTFGETVAIGPIGSFAGDFSAVADWCLFRSTIRNQPQPSALNGLLLPAALVDEQRSDPVEDVMFMRDEVADLAWAIEGIVTGSDGRALDRHSATVSNPSAIPSPVAATSSDSTPLRYQLETDVPAYWFPLVPDPDPKKALFNRLILARVGGGESVPLGNILRPGQPLVIRQEEVPREGAEVRRNYHSVRGIDGAVLLWCGRTKRAGRGEGSSSLRFDLALG